MSNNYINQISLGDEKGGYLFIYFNIVYSPVNHAGSPQDFHKLPPPISSLPSYKSFTTEQNKHKSCYKQENNAHPDTDPQPKIRDCRGR